MKNIRNAYGCRDTQVSNTWESHKNPSSIIKTKELQSRKSKKQDKQNTKNPPKQKKPPKNNNNNNNNINIATKRNTPVLFDIHQSQMPKQKEKVTNTRSLHFPMQQRGVLSLLEWTDTQVAHSSYFIQTYARLIGLGINEVILLLLPLICSKKSLLFISWLSSSSDPK